MESITAPFGLARAGAHHVRVEQAPERFLRGRVENPDIAQLHEGVPITHVLVWCAAGTLGWMGLAGLAVLIMKLL